MNQEEVVLGSLSMALTAHRPQQPQRISVHAASTLASWQAGLQLSCLATPPGASRHLPGTLASG